MPTWLIGLKDLPLQPRPLILLQILPGPFKVRKQFLVDRLLNRVQIWSAMRVRKFLLEKATAGDLKKERVPASQPEQPVPLFGRKGAMNILCGGQNECIGLFERQGTQGAGKKDIK